MTSRLGLHVCYNNKHERVRKASYYVYPTFGAYIKSIDNGTQLVIINKQAPERFEIFITFTAKFIKLCKISSAYIVICGRHFRSDADLASILRNDAVLTLA